MDGEVQDLTEAEGAASPAPVSDYHLVLSGPGLNLDRDVTEAQAWGVLAVIFGQQAVQPSNGSAPASSARSETADRPTAAPSQGPKKPKTSVREYLAEVKASTNTQKIAAFAAFLEEHHGKETFTREDVSQLFQQAREKKPGNLPRDFSAALRNQWIAEGSEDGTFYITRTGYDAVHGQFRNE